MAKLVKLAVDAMGGDNAPDVVLEGISLALQSDPDIEICVVGKSEIVEPFAKDHERCIAISASEVIEMGDHPTEAVKTKKDSSIVVGCQLVRDGKADGFFSAGSTGACLAAATLIIGRIKGVKRPALGVIIPAYKKPTFLMDVGANADCKPEYLVQFAQMGSIYMKEVMHVENPGIGLLNIGEEETKGSIFAQDAYQLLKDQVSNFKGNCEGGNLCQGDFDVVVTDGFTGNVCLKTIEGSSKLILHYVKDALLSSIRSKLGALLVKPSLNSLKENINPDKYGGSPLLGVKGVCIIGHGSSNAEAIKNGIFAEANAVRANFTEMIADRISQSKHSRIDD